jgi:hypothetical protein
MKPLKLTPEEIAIITMMRRNSFQEIVVQMQDSVVTFVNQIVKYRRKKGGGLVFGNKTVKPRLPLKLIKDEITVITKLRSAPFQKISIYVKNGTVEYIEQTVKFKKKER